MVTKDDLIRYTVYLNIWQYFTLKIMHHMWFYPIF